MRSESRAQSSLSKRLDFGLFRSVSGIAKLFFRIGKAVGRLASATGRPLSRSQREYACGNQRFSFGSRELSTCNPRGVLAVAACQSAPDRDPVSAFKRDPLLIV